VRKSVSEKIGVIVINPDMARGPERAAVSIEVVHLPSRAQNTEQSAGSLWRGEISRKPGTAVSSGLHRPVPVRGPMEASGHFREKQSAPPNHLTT
jgi:hypothetical protein